MPHRQAAGPHAGLPRHAARLQAWRQRQIPGVSHASSRCNSAHGNTQLAWRHLPLHCLLSRSPRASLQHAAAAFAAEGAPGSRGAARWAQASGTGQQTLPVFGASHVSPSTMNPIRISRSRGSVAAHGALHAHRGGGAAEWARAARLDCDLLDYRHWNSVFRPELYAVPKCSCGSRCRWCS